MKRPIYENNKLKIDIPNPKKVKPKWELITETTNMNINRLIEVYKENPKHARILYFQGGKNKYTCFRCIKYMYDNGDINFVLFEKSFGISVTNRMYTSEKNVKSIIYKKETNKWYYKEGTAIRLLTFEFIGSFFQQIFNYSDRFKNVGYDMIKKELPWVRNLEEDTSYVSHGLAFNTIIQHKLFNLKAIYRYLFKVPYPVIKMLINNKKNNYNFNGNISFFLKMWPEIKKVLINVENLSEELYTHHMFMDTCKMAKSVGEKVNCSWGVNRLVEMHDKWSKEITNVLLLNQKKTPIHIHQVYEEFAKFSNLRMLMTNYDMVEDGMVMHHCVATYIDRVNNGSCAIYKINGYTMEVRKDFEKKLFWGQIRGVRNADCPNQLKVDVQNLLDDFNKNVLPTIEFRPETKATYSSHAFDVELPF